jgi:serine/threonine-protein kinase
MSMFQIGPYEVIAELDRDALGTTYLCRRDAALFRIMHVDERLARDARFCDALDRARPALALAHPQLVTAEVGAFGWGRYLASPYIESATLADLLATSPVCPPPLLARILRDVLAGLSAAHDRGHLHLHLSPDQLVIGCDGIARISELGLAEARGIAVPGITPYTAPRANQPPDARADVFALGAIAWSALTGHGLFAGHSEAGTRERLLHLPIPAPSEVGARPPRAWDAFVLRALARDPDERFASANELVDALDAIEAATHAEVGLWVESTFAEAFGRRRTLASELDPGEVQVCRLRDARPRPRFRRPATGNARAVALLAAAFASGIGVALLLP